MSSTTHTPQSNFQLIIDALANYANQTGINLSNNPFADKLQLSNSPDAIIELLHDREKAFKAVQPVPSRMVIGFHCTQHRKTETWLLYGHCWRVERTSTRRT